MKTNPCPAAAMRALLSAVLDAFWSRDLPHVRSEISIGADLSASVSIGGSAPVLILSGYPYYDGHGMQPSVRGAEPVLLPNDDIPAAAKAVMQAVRAAYDEHTADEQRAGLQRA